MKGRNQEEVNLRGGLASRWGLGEGWKASPKENLIFKMAVEF